MTAERPSYLWSVVCAWALTIAVGALTVAGVLAMFMRLGPDGDAALRTLCVISFAAVAGLALANANNAAAAAMHAMTRGTHWKQWHWPTLLPALICAAGFCLSSVIGVHLGWEIMTRGATHAELPEAPQVLIAAAFLAFAKPAMSWVIEGRRAMDKADADAAEALENTRLDALRQAEIASRNPPASDNVTHLRPRQRRTVVGAAAAASALLLGAPHDAAEAAPLTQQDAPTQPASDAPETQPETQAEAPQPAPKTRVSGAAKRKPTDYETRVSEARRLLTTQPDMSNREIARRTGVSPSKVDRLVREMTPLRASAASAA